MMRRIKAKRACFGKDISGNLTVEFALTVPLIAFTLLGTMEVGRVMFAQALLDGAVREAARYGITGQGTSQAGRLAVIENIVRERSLGFVDIEARELRTLVYRDFKSIGLAEPYLDGPPYDGQYNPGETFDDVNQNGFWDEDQGEPGIGRDGDVVVYSVEVSLPGMTRLLVEKLGEDEAFGLTTSIAVRNEPWDATGLLQQ